MHWSLLLIGTGIFGFGFGAVSDASLTLTMDSYPDVCNFLLYSSMEFQPRPVNLAYA